MFCFGIPIIFETKFSIEFSEGQIAWGCIVAALFFVYFSKTNPVLPDNPLDLESRWLCRNCGLDVCGGQEVASMERSITVEWESIYNTCTDLASVEAFILKQKSTAVYTHPSQRPTK